MSAPQIMVGDVRAQLRLMRAESVDCVVTSPPYWGLRDYGFDGQIGMERSLGEHLEVMVDVFRDVRRVLKRHGTVWLNYGDSYAAQPNGRSAADVRAIGNDDRTFRDKPFSTIGPIYQDDHSERQKSRQGRSGNLGNGGINGVALPMGRVVAGGTIKPKDLLMIPNRLAIALQDDGWYVRSEIIWHKPNPMPESVYDRPACAHEKIWLLSRSEDYFYNHEAIREPRTGNAHNRRAGPNSRVNVDRISVSKKAKVAPERSGVRNNESYDAAMGNMSGDTRNARNVWTIAPKAFRDAHFATFPPALAERCVKAGVPPTVCGCCGAVKGCGPICAMFARVPGRVLDPFGGAGTVGLVAEALGFASTLIEMNPEYAEMAERRLAAARSVESTPA